MGKKIPKDCDCETTEKIDDDIYELVRWTKDELTAGNREKEGQQEEIEVLTSKYPWKSGRRLLREIDWLIYWLIDSRITITQHK